MNKKKFGILLTVIFIMLIVAGIVVLCPQKKLINSAIECQVVDGFGNTTGTTRTVTIQGSYKDYLILQDRFEGDIEIEGIEETVFEKETKKIAISDETPALIADIGVHEGVPQIRSVGQLWTKPEFESFVISLSVEGAEQEYLCFPNEEAFLMMLE